MIILLILTWAYSKPIQLLAIIIQLLSYSWLFAINGLLHQASLSLTISWSLLKLWWCYPTISSSVLPFSSCLLSFPASRFFPVSQLFASCGQSIGASASASVLPMNDQDQFPLWLTNWSSCNPRDSQESFTALQFKSIRFSVLNLLYGPTLIFTHDYWKNHSFDYTEFCH